jgi:hypothetical protein
MLLRDLLLPELGRELAATKRMLERVPAGNNEFRPHAKSYTLAELAGHVAEMPTLVELPLTEFPGIGTDVDLTASGYQPFVMDSPGQALAVFNQKAASLLSVVSVTENARFQEECRLLWDGSVVFAGTRYEAYRSLGLNHMLHHRAQLGVYLRLLEVPLPATPYGPSADEQPS